MTAGGAPRLGVGIVGLDHWYAGIEHVLECRVTGATPAAGIDDARTNLAVCLAFYDAARRGTVVTV